MENDEVEKEKKELFIQSLYTNVQNTFEQLDKAPYKILMVR
jgi:hypothetical protein